MTHAATPDVVVGDRLHIRGRGGQTRSCEVVELLPELTPRRRQWRVRWDDGEVTRLYEGAQMFVEHSASVEEQRVA